eukprot:CAMPEP_0185207520 /NCGR_PEP_ID=MMETSP1140-20130426/60428_1 /TAXON_ID=298111 /ORGANISM="Pavlova sp., Strain CCMP459" /LENGTH=63 /DNA_ID=CAMNT_0027775211 /DNA_START=37 /DNA_END=225 /DNA_ORIENTATION=+
MRILRTDLRRREYESLDLQIHCSHVPHLDDAFSRPLLELGTPEVEMCEPAVVLDGVDERVLDA